MGDVKQGDLSEPAMPTVYEFTREHDWPTFAIAVRTSVPPLSLAQPAAGVVRAIDPEQPIEEMRTMDQVLRANQVLSFRLTRPASRYRATVDKRRPVPQNGDIMAQTISRDVQTQEDARRLSDERRGTAWVGKSLVFKGELSSSEDMTIDGRVEGSIDVRNNTLVIGPDADIRADIAAGTVTVFGAVHGNIVARERVDVRQTGSIDGDILTPRLGLVDGGTLRGRVDTETRATQSKP